MKTGKHTNQVIIRAVGAVPLLIVLYGVPIVLTVLLLILAGLGIRFGISKYQEMQAEKEQGEDHQE